MSGNAVGILHFAGFASPYRGNFISSTEALRSQLEARGKQMVYLFPAAAKQREWAKELATQTNVYFLTGNDLKDIFLVRQIIKKHSIKFVHFHFCKLKYIFIVDAASLFRRIKKLVHLHCEMYIHKGIQRVIERVILSRKAFIGVSQAVTLQARKNYPKNKAVCVRNAIFFDRLKLGEELDKEELGLNPKAKTLLMFGHDYEVKGVDLAIEAVRRLGADGAQLQLVVVATDIEKATAKTVEYFGNVPPFVHILSARESVAEYYRLCDVFLAPSRREGFSYAAVEASSMALPIVLSNIAAHSELLLPYGFYFNSGDENDLAQQIKLALEEAPKMQEKLSIQAIELKKTYRLEEWVKQITNIYNEM